MCVRGRVFPNRVYARISYGDSGRIQERSAEKELKNRRKERFEERTRVSLFLEAVNSSLLPFRGNRGAS